MRTLLLVVTLWTVGLPLPAQAEWQVRTAFTTQRFLRDDPPGNAVAVELSAARNEWRSFQIVMRSTAPVRGVNIVAGDLVGPNGSVLRAADAKLFRQHQIHIEKSSPQSAKQRIEPFRPGWYPDALIPFTHPTTGKPLAGPRFTAVPFDLPAEQTHGFWVDLYVPSQAAPGVYRGEYRVTAEGAAAVAVPVRLTVSNFELPAVPTLRTEFGAPAHTLRSYYQKRADDGKGKAPTDWKTVEAQCAQLFCDHRLNAAPPFSFVPAAQPDGSYRIADDRIGELRQFIDRYHVNAVPIPVGPEHVVKDPEKDKAKLHAWLAAYDRAAKTLNRPNVLLYRYLLDEPNTPEAYQFVQRWGRSIREAKSSVRMLVVEQPQTQDPAWGDLYGAVDIWCPLFALFEEKPAAQRQAQGEAIWTYTALCQGANPTPFWEIDLNLINYRAPTWIMWRYRINGLLYWSVCYWSQVADPWTQPLTYNKAFNGEGSLTYPAHEVGYDGLVPSIRLKAIRDSVQDYEYMAMLERQGLAAEADRIVRPLAESWNRWSLDPAAYETAKAQLAALIVAKKRSAR